jgi:5-methylcytosine-specific restriction endonuclease McrA
VVDHIVKHEGDQVRFWDEANNWQALCRACHDGDKQRLEKSGFERTKFDADGKVIW